MKEGNEKYTQIILDYMEEYDKTQQGVAKALNVSSATVSDWLSGKVGITRRNRANIEAQLVNPRTIARLRGAEVDGVLQRIVAGVLNSTTLSAEAKAEVYEIIKKEKELK